MVFEYYTPNGLLCYNQGNTSEHESHPRRLLKCVRDSRQ